MSKLEEQFYLHIRCIKNIPQPEREYKFHRNRGWRFDFAWPKYKLAVEIDGMTFGKAIGKKCPVCKHTPMTYGRHSKGLGYRLDALKIFEAECLGWKVRRFDSQEVKSGEAVIMLEDIFKRLDRINH